MHSPPQGCQSGVQRPLLSLLFFLKCSNREGKAWLCISWTGSRPQASCESPRKTQNCLVLWSSYFFPILGMSKIWIFLFLIIQSVYHGKPLLCIKLHLLLWIPCNSSARQGLWETRVGSQQHSSVSAFHHLFCWLQAWLVTRTFFLLECLKYASFSRDRYLVLVGSSPGMSQEQCVVAAPTNILLHSHSKFLLLAFVWVMKKSIKTEIIP